jgi:hypothetical protein
LEGQRLQVGGRSLACMAKLVASEIYFTVICGAGKFGFGLAALGTWIHDSLPTLHVCTIGNATTPGDFGNSTVRNTFRFFPGAAPSNVTTSPDIDVTIDFGPVGFATFTPDGILICSLVVGEVPQPCSTVKLTTTFAPAFTTAGFGSIWACAPTAVNAPKLTKPNDNSNVRLSW